MPAFVDEIIIGKEVKDTQRRKRGNDDNFFLGSRDYIDYNKIIPVFFLFVRCSHSLYKMSEYLI